MDEGGNQELGWFMQSSDSVRAFSERYQSFPAGMGGAILQRASLDRDASRRTFRRHGRARVARSGSSGMVPPFSPLESSEVTLCTKHLSFSTFENRESG